MVRLDEPYKYSYNSYHSPQLLKMKQVLDAEFKITGYTQGKKGKAVGALMLIMENETGKRFDLTPSLDMETRYKLYKKFGEVEQNGKTHFENNYKDQMLTVYFDDWSTDKIPIRARTCSEANQNKTSLNIRPPGI